METTTIYLILSLIVNLIFFLLYREQKEREQLQEQIIKKQEKQIQLLEKMDDLKKQTN
jgi:preprotein translocase subunit YajC